MVLALLENFEVDCMEMKNKHHLALVTSCRWFCAFEFVFPILWAGKNKFLPVRAGTIDAVVEAMTVHVDNAGLLKQACATLFQIYKLQGE